MRAFVSAALLIVAPFPLAAQNAPTPAPSVTPAPFVPPSPVVFDLPEASSQGSITLSSQALAGGVVPEPASGNGGNVSPDLAWSKPPRDTKSFVLLVEDPDGNRDGAPVRHWMVFDIDPATRALPTGVQPGLAVPRMTQALNVRGAIGHAGPRPRAGTTHHYHFELFALDTRLGLTDQASRAAVVAGLAGHVLAKGRIIATFTGH
jgi:Raf kinase inhibitor-like YbhB/YbcL family protein